LTTNTISSIGEITQTDLDTKQNNIISTTDLTCNNISVTKTAPTENDELTSKIYVDTRLLEKQDALIAGSNIIIDNITDENGITTNTISSINQITQEDLDTKQNNIVSTDDLTCNSISVTKTAPTENDELTSKIYVDNGLSEKQPNILSTDDLTCNSISVTNTTPIENDELTSKIYVDNGLSEKQDILIPGSNIIIDVITDENGITTNTISSTGGTDLNSSSNIITGTIDSASITARTGTTITAPTITAGTNLLYGSTNVGTKIGQLETSLNGKQSTLVAGDNITISNNTISSTGGTDLNSSSDIITGSISSGDITTRAGASIKAQSIRLKLFLMIRI